MKESDVFSILTAPRRNSAHWEQEETTWGEVCAWVDAPAAKKEAGNYLFGTMVETTVTTHGGKKLPEPCTGMHRRKDAITSRSVLSLDIDKADQEFADRVELTFPWAFILHTTFQSSPDAPRYRLLVPLSREVKPDEYIELATSVMQDLGREQFDPGSDQPERYMFRPAAEHKEWYFSLVQDGDALDVETVLLEFEEDLSELAIPRPARTKRDPFEIDGVIGAFNTTYEDWDLLIDTYELPYEKITDDRYHLVGSRSEAGMGPVAGVRGFVFSHHANDPAYGKTCSAFDLVRLHRFGDLDEDSKPQTPVNKLPSQEAMLELAGQDARVLHTLVGEDFDDEVEEAQQSHSWKVKLKWNRGGTEILDRISNWDLIVENDRVFAGLRYNELAMSPESETNLPWRNITLLTATISHTDRSEMRHYVEREYGIRPAAAWMDSLIDTKAARHLYNPVRDYLEDLVWDRMPRLEEALPVRHNDWTRKVSRKSLVAAVARMLDPGVKWDHTLVLQGDEGLGKSWWIDKMARGYSSSLGDITNKDTLLAMQRSWIMVADEGHSLRKGDADALKEFLTKTQDVFRMPYDRETLVHRRHSVIWSSVNDEVFLRRQEGNRRFLVVQVEDKVDFDKITDHYVDQVWAEAVYLYKAGELLYLDADESITAAIEREKFIEEDALVGIIEEYLERLVPEDWWERSPDQRVDWIEAYNQGFESDGTLKITQTCSTQIWVEALGRRVGDHRRTDLLDINNALKRMPGWEPEEGRRRIPGYGSQLVFTRVNDLDLI